MSQTRRTRKQWNAIIARQESSGLSATQFCREFQLNYDTFCARKDAIRSGPASHNILKQWHAGWNNVLHHHLPLCK